MVEKLLTDKGLRPTPHRIRIGQRVLKEHCHFTAEEIYDWASSLKQKASRATVYNILNEFVAVGLLKSFFSTSMGITIYDSNTDEHFHFYDVDSKEIVDLDPSVLSVDIKTLKNYKVERMDILLTGRRRNA